MLGWGYRFCEKKMLIENEMTTKEADKFMTKFDNIYKGGLTEEAKQLLAMSEKLMWDDEMIDKKEKLLEVYCKSFKIKMKVYDLI